MSRPHFNLEPMKNFHGPSRQFSARPAGPARPTYPTGPGAAGHSPAGHSPAGRGALSHSPAGHGAVGHSPAGIEPAGFELAKLARAHHARTVADLGSILRHPRSLARPLPGWRPPSLVLPALAGTPSLTIALTRHRVGPRAKARVLGYGEAREPAYMVSARFTDPTGAAVNSSAAEGWVRCLAAEPLGGAIHEIGTGQASTFVWLVDHNFAALYSPISMFAGYDQAA